MINKIKNWFVGIKYSFRNYKRLFKVQNEANKSMVSDYLERSEKEKPRYRWHEWLLIGAFHVLTAIPFIIVGLILEIRDWIKKEKK